MDKMLTVFGEAPCRILNSVGAYSLGRELGCGTCIAAKDWAASAPNPEVFAWDAIQACIFGGWIMLCLCVALMGWLISAVIRTAGE
jgi:hypothetical protein